MIYDSSVLLNSSCNFDEIITVQEVINEVKDKYSKLHLLGRNIKILEPSKEYIEKIKIAAEKTGDIYKLSQTDIKLLALALETNDVIITDDYDIQNLAKFLKIKYKTFKQTGIKKIYIFKKRCKYCKREIKGNICEFCGNR
ncbi:MAG: ribonuclease VapC [Candidatus Aenigmatarchaeota archaeon]|nr:ribonuclease VapC [Candidatus Aenigmarchaeota archaeon]